MVPTKSILFTLSKRVPGGIGILTLKPIPNIDIRHKGILIKNAHLHLIIYLII